MKWVSLTLALAAIVALAEFLLALEQANLQSSLPRPESGMELLNTFRCHAAESKVVTTRGIEDNFAIGGEEPARVNPRVEDERPWYTRRTDYDDPQPDGEVLDYFDLSSNLATAMLVIKLRIINDTGNERVRLGEFASSSADLTSKRSRIHVSSLKMMNSNGPWLHFGEIYWVSLSDLQLESGVSILKFIQQAGGSQRLDVAIADDIMVDFIGIATCDRPKSKTGLTFAYLPKFSNTSNDTAAFECRADKTSKRYCDPFRGDHPCDSKLPLLCFADRALPAPQQVGKEVADDILTRRWSGGEVAATSPIQASVFRTIGEADQFCAAQFGEEWRVAEWHLGGSGWGFSAKSGGRKFFDRYWVDVRGQPYANCWDHDNAR